MDFFWIAEDIKNLISAYFKYTYVRFFNDKYSTNRQKLNIGIMIRCVISPLFFILVMEMILRSAEVNTNEITSPSMTAFICDWHRWQDLSKLLKDGLHFIDKCDLLNKDKIWCIYFWLLPKLSRPMQVYKLSITKVETMEWLISKYTKKNGWEYLNP